MDTSPFTARADLGFAWSVKDSFLQYIRGMSDGDIQWTAGAAVTNVGEFFFPHADARTAAEGTVLSFRGVVTFTAHRGLLSVSIAHPRILLRDGSADLLNQAGGYSEKIGSITLAPRIADGDVAMWMNCAVALDEAGAELFGGTYAAGEQLAPLTVRVPARALGLAGAAVTA